MGWTMGEDRPMSPTARQARETANVQLSARMGRWQSAGQASWRQSVVGFATELEDPESNRSRLGAFAVEGLSMQKSAGGNELR
jgi:hypothetical protein